MKYLIKFFIILVVGFFLHSCTTIDKKANKAISKEEAKLNEWLNKPVSELKIEFGKPDRIEFLDTRNRYYVYVTKKLNIKCERKFEINSNNIVVGFSSKNCF